jgi:hypothetical protein
VSEFENVSEFGVGSVMSNSWTMLWRRPVEFMLCAFLSSALGFVLTKGVTFVAGLVGISAAHRSPEAIANMGIAAILTFLVGILAVIIINTLVAMLVQGAVVYAVFRTFIRGHVSMSEAFSRSLPRVLPLLMGGGLAQLAAVGVLMLPVFAGLVARFIIGPRVGVVLAVLLTLCALVFIVIFSCMWFVFAPACVVERFGPMDSLRRSAELTKGHRGTLFGTILLSIILGWIFLMIVRFIQGIIIVATHTIIIGQGVGFVLTLPFLAYMSILPAVAYYKLRMVKEGLVQESLADIFD